MRQPVDGVRLPPTISDHLGQVFVGLAGDVMKADCYTLVCSFALQWLASRKRPLGVADQ